MFQDQVWNLFPVAFHRRAPIHLVAVISAVCNDDVSVRRHGDALRPVQRAGEGVDKGEEGPGRVEDLDARVAPVSHNDVVLVVDRDAGGGVELAVALAVRAKAELELALGVKHLASKNIKSDNASNRGKLLHGVTLNAFK